MQTLLYTTLRSLGRAARCRFQSLVRSLSQPAQCFLQSSRVTGSAFIYLHFTQSPAILYARPGGLRVHTLPCFNQCHRGSYDAARRSLNSYGRHFRTFAVMAVWRTANLGEDYRNLRRSRLCRRAISRWLRGRTATNTCLFANCQNAKRQDYARYAPESAKFCTSTTQPGNPNVYHYQARRSPADVI